MIIGTNLDTTPWSVHHGEPRLLLQKGFNLQDVSDGLYGRHLHVYNWPEGELKQTIDLGHDGLLPLEVSARKFHYIKLIIDLILKYFKFVGYRLWMWIF